MKTVRTNLLRSANSVDKWQTCIRTNMSGKPTSRPTKTDAGQVSVRIHQYEEGTHGGDSNSDSGGGNNRRRHDAPEKRHGPRRDRRLANGSDCERGGPTCVKD